MKNTIGGVKASLRLYIPGYKWNKRRYHILAKYGGKIKMNTSNIADFP